jgi:3-oxoacyl-[acyl-carrier-protein] synthase II
MGIISPIGNTIDEFTEALRAGRSGADRITKFDPSNHRAQIACEVKGFSLDNFLTPEWVERFRAVEDPSPLYTLAAAEQAMTEAGLAAGSYNPFRSAVIIGTGIGGVSTYETETRESEQRGKERGARGVSAFTIPNFMPNGLAANICQRFGIHGLSLTGNSACDSGTTMSGFAYRQIRDGYYDMIITGGAEAAVTPIAVAAFSNMRALTRRHNNPEHERWRPENASRPFDKDRDGFVIGEGAGIMVFEEYEHARARGAHPIAEVVGFGASCDAQDIVRPYETGEYAAEAIKSALKEAGVSPEQVNYINAHGTSTPLGDIAETRAIKIAFGTSAHQIPTSSTKSMHGHGLGAAGGIEAIAALIAMREGFIPPTINYETPDPECDLDYVPNHAREANLRVAISETFGFGGHNGVLVFRKT